jgi:hypothetical protein
MKEKPEKRVFFDEYAAICRKHGMYVTNPYESGDQVCDDSESVELHLQEVERWLY